VLDEAHAFWLRGPRPSELRGCTSRFDELPGVMAHLAAGRLPALYHTITYDEA
jgi:hypothetical protein